MQTVEDKTVISDLRWYASDWYGQLITVSGDFSQTVHRFCPPRLQKLDRLKYCVANNLQNIYVHVAS